MDGFIIGLSIGLTIFVITSAIVLIRRRKNNTRHPGQVISAPVVVTSATHTAPGGYPVTQMPVGASTTTTTYQTQAVLTSYPRQEPYTIYCPEVPNSSTIVITKTETSTAAV